ncbi:AbrB/MazE/SpoVT family DNA-binding domain-containing protein [Sphingomonas sp. RS2018]
MTKEYLAKTFKSGNSVALRLPKALGVGEGAQMRVREEAGKFILEPTDAPKRKFNVDKVFGSVKGLKVIADEDRVFEDRPLRFD